MKHIHVGDSRFRYDAHPFPAFRCRVEKGSTRLILPLSHIVPVTTYTVRVKTHEKDILGVVSTQQEAERIFATYEERAEYSSAEILETQTLPEGAFSVYRHGDRHIVVKETDTSNRVLACIGYARCFMQFAENVGMSATVLMCESSSTDTGERMDFVAIFDIGQSLIVKIAEDNSVSPFMIVYEWTGADMIVSRVDEHDIETFLLLKRLNEGELPPDAKKL